MQEQNQEAKQVIVKKVLYRGAYVDVTNPSPLLNLRSGKVATTGEIQGWFCPRCKGNTVCVFLESFGYMGFCAKPECVKDDVFYQKNKSIKPPKEKKHIDASTEFRVGNRYYNACLAKFHAGNEQKEIISRWLAKPNNALVLFGNPGVGKTYFCMAVANYLFEKDIKPVYFNEKRLFELLQSGMNEGSNQYSEVRKISLAEFLILDDFGSCKMTDWKEEILFDLIDQRYNSQLPFVITTNLDIKGIQEIWGDRIARRLNASENVKLTLTEVYDRKANIWE